MGNPKLDGFSGPMADWVLWIISCLPCFCRLYLIYDKICPTKRREWAIKYRQIREKNMISNEEVITKLLTVIVATVSISMAAFSPVVALQLGVFKG